MAERIKALVEPALLIWARETAAVTPDDAAKALRVPLEVLEAWESGEDVPTIAQLRRLAERYKRPLSVFFLPEPPKDFQALRDFRRLPEAAVGRYSPQLAFEVRAAHERRLIALDVLDALGEEPERLEIRAALRDDPEALADHVRERLGISFDQQVRWGEPAKAFKAWRDAIESAGVLVFVLSGAHHQVALSEMRGFAIASDPLPTIVVNGKDRSNGRTFTLLHELGHVLLGQSVIENEIEAGDTLPAPDRAIETFCNRFAAAALMPRTRLLAEPILIAKQQSKTPWSDLEIVTLARRYGVSREAMLVRLVGLGRAERSFYLEKRAEYARQYEEAEEIETSGFAPYQYQVLSHLGRGFARLILQGYYDNRLTLSTVSGYLGMQAKYVPSLERAAFAPGG